MKQYSKSVILLIFSFLFLISLECVAQDLPDYAASDPDLIVNSIDNSVDTLTIPEKIDEINKSFDELIAVFEQAFDSIQKNIPNTAKGVKKDIDNNTFINKFSAWSDSIVKWFENTETVKGVKKDMNN